MENKKDCKYEIDMVIDYVFNEINNKGLIDWNDIELMENALDDVRLIIYKQLKSCVPLSKKHKFSELLERMGKINMLEGMIVERLHLTL